MKQLSGLDASFLYLETPEMPMHVGSLNLYELPASHRGSWLAALRRHVAARLPLMPVLRRKLARMPLNLAAPAWVDAEPDLDEHIVGVTLPAGSGLAELEMQVGLLHAQLLDRSRPLWKFFVFEGLAPGDAGQRRCAVYTQLHHAAVDGQAAVALAQALLDLGPRPRKVETPPARARKGRLGAVEMLRGALAHQFEQVVDLVKALPSTVGAVSQIAARTAGEAVGDGVDSLLARVRGTARQRATGVSNLGLAPRTRLNATVSNERAFAAVTLPLAELNAARRRQGASLNDALLAICSGALRRWFADHGPLPRKSLVAAVPISLRSAGDATANTQASMSLISLGTHLADPAARLAHVKAASASMKATVGSMRSLLPTDFPSLGVPWLMEGLTSIYGRAGLADRIPPLANVTISNVPGPTVPLWLAGAKLLADYPTSIVVHGVALNITVQSYHESLDIGIVACARAMPEVAEFAAHIETAFLELKSLPAAASPAPAPAPVTKRRRTVSVTRATRGSPRVAARPARRPSR
jgi:WS/DGAT/MGAT family acyltransferase